MRQAAKREDVKEVPKMTVKSTPWRTDNPERDVYSVLITITRTEDRVEVCTGVRDVQYYDDLTRRQIYDLAWLARGLGASLMPELKELRVLVLSHADTCSEAIVVTEYDGLNDFEARKKMTAAALATEVDNTDDFTDSEWNLMRVAQEAFERFWEDEWALGSSIAAEVYRATGVSQGDIIKIDEGDIKDLCPSLSVQEPGSVRRFFGGAAEVDSGTVTGTKIEVQSNEWNAKDPVLERLVQDVALSQDGLGEHFTVCVIIDSLTGTYSVTGYRGGFRVGGVYGALSHSLVLTKGRELTSEFKDMHLYGLRLLLEAEED